VNVIALIGSTEYDGPEVNVNIIWSSSTNGHGTTTHERRKRMIYREDLQKATCGHTDCECIVGTVDNPMHINSRCHSGAPFFLDYAEGIMRAVCAECNEMVMLFAVASRQSLS
jgi:hypothetical protein